MNHFDLDEKWFYVVSTNGWVWVCEDRMTKQDIEDLKNIPVRSKRYVTKVMFITVVGRPIPELEFDGKLYIKRCSAPKIALRNSKYHKKDDVYEKDCNVTGKFFIARCKEIVVAIEDLYSRWDVAVHGPCPEEVVVQIDGAGPHRAQHVENELARIGNEATPRVVFWRQAAQCPQVFLLRIVLCNGFLLFLYLIGAPFSSDN